MYELNADLYEFSMAAVYRKTLPNARATFEVAARKLPDGWGYGVVTGLEPILDYLEKLQFSTLQAAFVASRLPFRSESDRKDLIGYLEDFKFHGDVWAMPEGTVFFAGEPVLRVSGPIAEAQIVETVILAILNGSTWASTKMARCVVAAEGRPVYEFGARRACGVEAGLLTSRAAFIGGASATSNVEAGRLFGIPTVGTMAHSLIMALGEEVAFREFGKVFSNATALVDTYDTERGIERAKAQIPDLVGVRVDSDLFAVNPVKACASGDLDEYTIARLVPLGYESFAVGTKVVSGGTPGFAYKLVEVHSPDWDTKKHPIKLSAGKASMPGVKQVARFYDQRKDVVCLESEAQELLLPGGGSLLGPFMSFGKVLARGNFTNTARRRCIDGVQMLHRRGHAADWSISTSDGLFNLFSKANAEAK